MAVFPKRFEMALPGLPEVPLFGRYHYTSAQPGLPDHQHPDLTEICYLVSGEQFYTVGSRIFRLRGGEVFLTHPGERHGTGRHPESRGTLYWMGIRTGSRNQNLFGLGKSDSQRLRSALVNLPERHFSGTRAMKVFLDSIASQCFDEPTGLRRIELQVCVMGFLLEVIRTGRKVEESDTDERIRRVIREVRIDPARPWSVRDLARVAELSTSRFKVLFREQTGLPPLEYLIRLRVDAAGELLQSSKKSITEIAFHLGFSSSQYFATVFKRYRGVTPLQFREGAFDRKKP